MHSKRNLNYKYIILFLGGCLFAETGSIHGIISDGINGAPLEGANINIKNNQLGAVSSSNGSFTVLDLPSGYYTLIISYIGYETLTLPDIWVRPNAYDLLDIELNQQVLKLDGLVVEESYFKSSSINQEQSTVFRNSEIRRAPGAAQELSRILNSLPSVASVGENRQDMMVRGGGPTENGFIIDNIPIPGISHFVQEDGRSNGPIGIINTEMVEDIEFFSNGFSAKYGNRLSSYGDIKYRNGNMKSTEGNFSLGIGGMGALIEGPILDNASYIISFRRSYLDLIADAINAGGIPSYDDIQGKITVKPNFSNTFTFLTVNGGSLYNRAKKDAQSENLSDYGKRKANQKTLGVNYQRIWNKNAFSNSSISYTSQFIDAFFKNIFSDNMSYLANNNSNYIQFRQINQLYLNKAASTEFGFEAIRKDTKYNFSINSLDIDQTVSLLNLSAFSTFKFSFSNQYLVSIGGRVDWNDFEEKYLYSPRFNVRYLLPLGFGSLTYNSGLYHQNPHEIYMSINSNKNIQSVKAIQNSLTYEKLLTSSTKLSLSIYKKIYRDAPMLPKQEGVNEPIFLMDQSRIYGDINSNGVSDASGVEILIEKKRAENFYGLVGGTLFNTSYKDQYGIRRNREYNYRYILNIVGGYRPKSKWELSIRWSLFGGKPYTPINERLSEELQREILYLDKWNEEKTPVYHSLFLRYDYRLNFSFGNLVGFVEFWNAYNRENIETIFWDNGIKEITYFNFIPVGGFEIEF
tara:strand:+ start:8597 stop:10834 length:2238 start_codon:yes stop_codon:yes gene_type:complete